MRSSREYTANKRSTNASSQATERGEDAGDYPRPRRTMRRPAGGEDLMTVIQGLISETAGRSRQCSLAPAQIRRFVRYNPWRGFREKYDQQQGYIPFDKIVQPIAAPLGKSSELVATFSQALRSRGCPGKTERLIRACFIVIFFNATVYGRCRE